MLDSIGAFAAGLAMGWLILEKLKPAVSLKRLSFCLAVTGGLAGLALASSVQASGAVIVGILMGIIANEAVRLKLIGE